MKGLTKVLCLSLLAVPLLASAGKVYKIVDKYGRVTYTDKPPANLKESDALELPDINTHNSNVSDRRKPARMEKPEEPQPFRYENIAIQTPQHEQTIPPGQTQVQIELALTPELVDGHLIQILFDGAPNGEPSVVTRYTLSDMNRGEHIIQAEVTDAEGKVVGRSKPVTIYVKRPTVSDTSLPQPNNDDGSSKDNNARPRGFSNGSESPFKFNPQSNSRKNASNP